MRTIFLDMDGVLADFDKHAFDCFGIVTTKDGPDPEGLWDRIREHGNFYGSLPLMPDAEELVTGVFRTASCRDVVIVLTEVPSSVPGVGTQKRAWLAQYFPELWMIGCSARNKYLHMRNIGDILIDDRPKHKDYWTQAGGVWITHTSAVDSLRQLQGLIHATE